MYCIWYIDYFQQTWLTDMLSSKCCNLTFYLIDDLKALLDDSIEVIWVIAITRSKSLYLSIESGA